MKEGVYINESIMLFNGECLDIMDKLIKKQMKVDAIICDLPYGTTKCSWDNLIDMNEMWIRLKVIRKETTPTLLFGSEPFSSKLRLSNEEEYQYDWYMRKSRPTGQNNPHFRPLKDIETIRVFYQNQPTYNPQGLKSCNKIRKNPRRNREENRRIAGYNGGEMKNEYYIQKFTGYPRQIIEVESKVKPFHPSQKTIELMEYLIKTYTNEGDVVLDFTMGSGTTGVACKNLGRKFVGIEIDTKFYDIAVDRIGINEV